MEQGVLSRRDASSTCSEVAQLHRYKWDHLTHSGMVPSHCGNLEGHLFGGERDLVKAAEGANENWNSGIKEAIPFPHVECICNKSSNI